MFFACPPICNSKNSALKLIQISEDTTSYFDDKIVSESVRNQRKNVFKTHALAVPLIVFSLIFGCFLEAPGGYFGSFGVQIELKMLPQMRF